MAGVRGAAASGGVGSLRPGETEGLMTIGDVLQMVGDKNVSKPITPSDAEAIAFAESLATGHQTVKGSIGAQAMSFANFNVNSGLIRADYGGLAAKTAQQQQQQQEGEKGKPSPQVQPLGETGGYNVAGGQPRTLGEVLVDVKERLDNDKAILPADAARIQQVEMRAHPLGIVEPGGVAATAMEIAQKNAETLQQREHSQQQAQAQA
ncbi:hypothetical protein CBR_g26325 [Chara braunii]|uniref:SMP domain-containing protein n=1 Tax=Chara braunii TaxID=69332 RepID=A0A388L7L9_CHABU|nr:hypothetical protein CBR_g26325 [Chara braunii]|eukprot:GBG78295.1 hypothetical protein CBR_g26325 [Chara braunii]